MKTFTQEELLAEAIHTEVENTRSLNRLQRLEEEKKMDEAAPKAPYSGGVIRYHSKIGQPTTIQFINTEQEGLPENLFYRRPGKRTHHHHKHYHHKHHHHKRKL